MSKGIFAHDRFVWLRLNACDGSDKPAGWVDLFGVDIGIESAKDIVSDLQCHNDLFKCSIACTLTKSVDGTLYLSCTVHDRFKRVGYAKTQVVMIVYRDNSSAFGVFTHLFDHCANFKRKSETDGIRKVDGGCTCLNDGIWNLFHKTNLRTPSIFTAEFHIFYKCTCIGDSIDSTSDDLVRFHLQFVLHMDRTGCNKGVNTFFLSLCNCFPCSFYVSFERTCQRTDCRVFYSLGYLVNSIEISRACCRKSCFDDIHTQTLKLCSDLDLLFCIHGSAGALLPVAQCGVEYFNVFCCHTVCLVVCNTAKMIVKTVEKLSNSTQKGVIRN